MQTFRDQSPTLKKLQQEKKEVLKQMLSGCTEPQVLLFKRMYSHKNLDLPISDVVDQMPDEKIDWAISQVERTLAKKSTGETERFK